MEAGTAARQQGARPEIVLDGLRSRPRGWLEWLTTTDHKKIGILYLFATFLFFILGGVEALVMRLQLAQPSNTLVDPETYNGLVTIHGTTMVFLFVVPVMAGFGNYLVPLMIGARDMAFPRLNALSFWLLLFGGIAFYMSVFFEPSSGLDDVLAALRRRLLAGRRSGRLDLPDPHHRPVLDHRRDQLRRHDPQHARAGHGLGAHAAVRLDDPRLQLSADRSAARGRRGGDDAADRPPLRHRVLRSHGGDPLLWQHLFWFFGHPEVYIMVLPAFGMVSEILPVFARKPIFGYRAIAASTVAIAFLGLLGRTMFTTPTATVVLAFFMLSSFTIAVPTGIKIFNWIATLWRGRIVFKTPLYFAAALPALFVIGGISGVMLAVFPSTGSCTTRTSLSRTSTTCSSAARSSGCSAGSTTGTRR